MSIFGERIKRLGNRLGIRDVGDLVNITGKETYYDYAVLLGKDNELDNDGREYYWNGGSMAATEWDTVVRPNTIASDALPGRWLKIEKNYPRTYSEEITNLVDGATVDVDFTHGLDTTYLIIQVYLVSQSFHAATGVDVLLGLDTAFAGDIEVGILNSSTVKLYIASAPAQDYRIVMTTIVAPLGLP